jgi:hypothetical protein
VIRLGEGVGWSAVFRCMAAEAPPARKLATLLNHGATASYIYAFCTLVWLCQRNGNGTIRTYVSGMQAPKSFNLKEGNPLRYRQSLGHHSLTEVPKSSNGASTA